VNLTSQVYDQLHGSSLLASGPSSPLNKASDEPG
jgi:hypothetical protein